MRFDERRFVANMFLGLLILTQAECFAQFQYGAAATAKDPKLVADQSSTSKWDFKRRRPNALKVEMALQEPTEVNFTDLPLNDALGYLKEVHNFTIWIDAKSLADEGISIDSLVTFVASDVSLKSTLRLILSPLLLDYIVKDDVLIITTSSVADETFENRVYNTSRISNLSPTELKEIITKIVNPGGWSVEKPSDSPAPAKSATAAASSGASTEAPIANAAPTAPAADASLGSICAVGNTLVIRQSYRIHEEIIELLDQLERQQESVEKAKPLRR